MLSLLDDKIKKVKLKQEVMMDSDFLVSSNCLSLRSWAGL